MLKTLPFKFFTLILFLKYLSACSPYFHQPLGPQKAQLGPETPMKKELLTLPEPKEKIVVAVYKFRDQTGQYKPSETGANWSTAVTQGATNILIRALEESGWFIPIERENISNLLNERKIIRSSREQYEGGSSVLLPPLLFAGLLIEGGIVSYETNVFTGGAGVRYFGTDASAKYREDRVTIYLRAVSTSNGKILINQESNGNTAIQTQYSEVRRTGADYTPLNQAEITQTGGVGNEAYQTQETPGGNIVMNYAWTMQNGAHNYAEQSQTEGFNLSTVSQTGNGNNAVVTQSQSIVQP